MEDDPDYRQLMNTMGALIVLPIIAYGIIRLLFHLLAGWFPAKGRHGNLAWDGRLRAVYRDRYVGSNQSQLSAQDIMVDLRCARWSAPYHHPGHEPADRA
jgi:hypothetical protein